MIKQVILAIVVAIATALIVILIGHLLVLGGIVEIGNFVKSISTIVGILAGIWWFFTHSTPSRTL